MNKYTKRLYLSTESLWGRHLEYGLFYTSNNRIAKISAAELINIELKSLSKVHD